VANEALTAGAVARLLGVAVTTLRTWHQRYGLGPSHHVPGHHRRYTADDLDRLAVMRRLTSQGVSPAEAAAWARRMPAPADAPRPAPGATEVPADPVRQPARDGGGHAIAVGRAAPAARGLARAAMRLDAPAIRDLLEESVQGRGVVETWETVVMPVLIGIGERYAATRLLVEVEHLTSRCVTEVFGNVARPASEQIPRVLLACADEEQHTLPLEALAAALAEAGTASRLLGARVPPGALAEAVARTGPTVVVVWSQLPGTADPAQLTRLLTGSGRPLVVAAAGPGWSHLGLPAEVAVLGSLDEALRVVHAAVGSTRPGG
jgi:DNA-binding transcriptional MerR regulator/methanogenic corrinoid protein MtbC1